MLLVTASVDATHSIVRDRELVRRLRSMLVTTIRFGYTRATVTDPAGVVHTRAGATLRDRVLTIRYGEQLQNVDVQSQVNNGRSGWSIVDSSGQTWLVKREGGCACGR